jgi:cell division protein FtsN
MHWRARFDAITTLALRAHDKVRDMSNWFADKLGPDPRRAGQQNLSGQTLAQRAQQPQAAPQQRQQQAAPQPARAPEPQRAAPPPKAAAQPAPLPPEEKKKKKGWF